MYTQMYQQKWIRWRDERRAITFPGDTHVTLRFCIQKWLEVCHAAIADHGFFAVALSGGSTPKAIFEGLCSAEYMKEIPWDKIKLFWSDERCVAPDHKDSNYKMAMDICFAKVPVRSENIFRMPADAENLDQAAKDYEETLKKELHKGLFDLVMLGMGDDGHIASLFPGTTAISETHRLVVANQVPQKGCQRMTLTYPGIHASRDIFIYVMGQGKAAMLKHVLQGPHLEAEKFPAYHVGQVKSPAIWIADLAAAHLIEPTPRRKP